MTLPEDPETRRAYFVGYLGETLVQVLYSETLEQAQEHARGALAHVIDGDVIVEAQVLTWRQALHVTNGHH